MAQLPGVTHATQSPQPVPAPLASLADRPFAYVLHGLVEAQLARSPATTPAPPSTTAPAERPAIASVIVGPQGAITVGAFTLWDRVRAPAASRASTASAA